MAEAVFERGNMASESVFFLITLVCLLSLIAGFLEKLKACLVYKLKPTT